MSLEPPAAAEAENVVPLPSWEQMSDLDKTIALMHVWKREHEGASYAVENYPAEYVDHPALVALDDDEACDHAKSVVGSIEEIYDRIGGDEYERLLNIDVDRVVACRTSQPAATVGSSSVTSSDDLPRDWQAVHILPGTPYPDEPSETQPPGWFVMSGFSDDPEEGAAFILEVDQALDRDDTGMSLERLAQAAAARLNGGVTA